MANGVDEQPQQIPPNGSNQRISLSLEILRTEINLAVSQLKLDLIKELASKQDVENLQRDFNEVKTIARENDRWIVALRPQIAVLIKEHDEMIKEVEDLKTSKAEEKAVANFKRYLLTGGVLTVVIMTIQVGLTIYLATHGIHASP